MKTRIISAAVGIVLLVIVGYFFNTALLDVAVMFLSVVAAHELISCVGLSGQKFFETVSLIFAAAFSSVYFNIFSTLTLLCEFVFAGFVLLFVLRHHEEIGIDKAAFAFFACTVVPRAFSVVLLFREYEKPLAYMLVILSLCTAWVNDTCAYFAGKAFGKRKLCEKISPRKTVEGFFGGVIGSVLVCGIGIFVFATGTGYSVNWISTALFLVVGTVSAVAGDLVSSVIKRQNGIKDFGKIMPGHGGIMDRFDSWLFVAPLLYIWNIYAPLVG